MCKFSIIVPIYNVEKYLDFCLQSIKNQSYTNYEVIMVDDGSTDSSKEIASKYINNQFKYYYKKNGGLSSARNYGVEKAIGEYLMFVDSDDYINKNTLKKINEHLRKYSELEVIRYELCTVNENCDIIKKYDCFPFSNEPIEKAFPILLKNKFVEPAPLYIINKEFYLKNDFKFSEGRFHEDFGLIPLILISAKRISSINFCGYYYMIRNNSIMTTNSYERTRKKIFDILYHFDYLYDNAKKVLNISQETLKTFNSYISIAIISKIKYLKKTDRKKLISELKKRDVVNLLLDNTLKRKIRKILYKINLNFSRWL